MSLEQYRKVPAIRTAAGNYDNSGRIFDTHLQELKGVGPFFERKLVAAGIENIEQLSRYDVAALSTALLGLCRNGAEKRSVTLNARRINQLPSQAREFLVRQAA